MPSRRRLLAKLLDGCPRFEAGRRFLGRCRGPRKASGGEMRSAFLGPRGGVRTDPHGPRSPGSGQGASAALILTTPEL